MTIYLGADHDGFTMKQQIKVWLLATGYKVADLGAETLITDDDYPVYAEKVAQAVAADLRSKKSAVGLLFCDSGGGVTIAANKIIGIRAVETYDEKSARHARNDNAANVACLAAGWLNLDEIKIILATFLATPFSQADRHQRRIDQITALEMSTLIK